jgi:hypothetical protein
LFPLNAPQRQPGDASGGLDFNGSDELNDDELNGPMQVAPADCASSIIPRSDSYTSALRSF